MYKISRFLYKANTYKIESSWGIALTTILSVRASLFFGYWYYYNILNFNEIFHYKENYLLWAYVFIVIIWRISDVNYLDMKYLLAYSPMLVMYNNSIERGLFEKWYRRASTLINIPIYDVLFIAFIIICLIL